MSRSNDSESSNMRDELASQCSLHHNNEIKCNNSTDNGTPCISNQVAQGQHQDALQCLK